jgi:hypothetical protein
MEHKIVRITEAEQNPNRKIDDLATEKLEAAEVIDRVQDVTMRLLLEKRYLLFHPWDKIASDLGYTQRWTLKKHEAALDAVQRILDERDGNRPEDSPPGS